MLSLLRSFIPGPWLAAGAVVAIVAGASAIYLKGRADGRAVIESRLAGDRIQILRDGKDITDEVLGADDETLCGFLVPGGCGLPDAAGGE